MTGVLIVDDHPVILQGFRRVVEDAGVAMIVEAADPVSGYRLFHRIRPQVAVVDLAFRGSGLAGLALIKRMRALEPRARILAFSMHRDPVIAARALEAGAIGYVFKDLPVQEFLAAFDAVREGSLHVRVGATYPLADAARAHAALESRATTGKVVLTL